MTVSKHPMQSERVDPDDAPELTDEFFEQADEYVGDRLVRRGRGRPVGSHKTATTIRLDDDVLEAFKATGRGWQTRVNAALKDWLATHKLA
jgi:uncharacterized protein (DUF4415 family)